MIDGMVASAMPAASNQTTRRGSAMPGLDSTHAVATRRDGTADRWMLPVTRTRLAHVEIVGALQKCGRPLDQAPPPKRAQAAADHHVIGGLLQPIET